MSPNNIKRLLRSPRNLLTSFLSLSNNSSPVQLLASRQTTPLSHSSNSSLKYALENHQLMLLLLNNRDNLLLWLPHHQLHLLFLINRHLPLRVQLRQISRLSHSSSISLTIRAILQSPMRCLFISSIRATQKHHLERAGSCTHPSNTSSLQ